jgi:hypothetical protein
MSTKNSELMVALLKELAVLKELDKKQQGMSKSDIRNAESEERQMRRLEISDRIKALAEPI